MDEEADAAAVAEEVAALVAEVNESTCKHVELDLIVRVWRVIGTGRGGGGGGGGGFRKFDTGPPERVIPLGYFDYSCQDDLVCKVTIEDVPYFNAPIFLENKEQIGKIDEIFGNLRDYYVTVKLGDNMKASSFQSQQKVPLKR